jgi:hypothetical protein
MGPRPSPKHSIDREDVNGNYEPGNCKWALDTEQSRNRRFFKAKSGVRGVYSNKGKWTARIRVGNDLINLGTYESVQEAEAARKRAEQKYWSGDDWHAAE